eukprot:4373404-Pyramimonas_sp.AAC.2
MIVIRMVRSRMMVRTRMIRSCRMRGVRAVRGRRTRGLIAARCLPLCFIRRAGCNSSQTSVAAPLAVSDPEASRCLIARGSTLWAFAQ